MRHQDQPITKYLLSIAASDNTCGAGIQQDIRVCAKLGVEPLSVLTALTTQGKKGLYEIYPTNMDFFARNLNQTLQEYPISVVKIGAVVSMEQLSIIRDLTIDQGFPIILDPVFSPTSGKAFLPDLDIIKWKSIVRDWINYLTPNLDEFKIIMQNNTEVLTNDFLLSSAKELNLSIILKGGHFTGETITDRLIQHDKISIKKKIRKNWIYQHGTGCTFSTAFACYLSKGFNPEDSFRNATDFVDVYFSNHPHNQQIIT